MKKVAIIMGSSSDFTVMESAVKQLTEFDIPYEVKVISAHRSPSLAKEFSSTAIENGFGIIIAAAGKAAHLAGVLAAYTTLPVIGVPIRSSAFGGLDSLLSTVQMPSGVPVATVAVDGAENAAILAAQILAVNEPALAEKLIAYKNALSLKVQEANIDISEKLKKYQ